MSESTPMTGSDDHPTALRPAHPVQVHPTLRLSVETPQDDDFDALADLFLGEDIPPPIPTPDATPDTAQGSTPRPAADRASIEAIVLGHLPVLASAWVRQYADHRAGELDSPVALVRVRASGTSVELVPERPIERAESLAAAVAAAKSIARAWIVQVDETAEPDLAAIADLDAITLLSGADEAATVASYRAIKAMAGRDDRELRIALMGSDPERASDAWTRVQRAAASMLDQPLTFAGCVPRIDAPRATTLYRGSSDLPLDQVLAMIRTTPGALTADPAAPTQGRISEIKDRLRPLPERPDGPPAPTRPTDGQHTPQTSAQATAQDEPVVCSLEDQPDGRSLSAHVAGLHAIELDCPDAPEVELAVADDGGLHLLARVQATPGAALEHLAIARAWAIKNRQLLAAAIPQLRPGTSQSASPPPVEHLLTDRPAAVRLLLDTPLRIHLLTPVPAASTAAWCSTPLN